MATAHHDLLEQARYLLTHDKGKPKQASLRRAISTAYYALFHLLTSEAAARLVTGTGRDAVRMMVRRSFGHQAMNAVCKDITKSSLPGKYQAVFGAVVPPLLQNVARAFVDLQQARHEADYDFSTSFSRLDATDFVLQAESAFHDWAAVRKTIPADSFLVLMLLHRKANQND